MVSDPEGLTPTTLRIWDFGGQDIYHGTHALFLKSRAIFPLVWTPASEQAKEHEHGGFKFRNQPLGYWLAYVKALGGRDSPVLVVQAQADRPEDEMEPPLPPGALAAFPFKKVLQYSASTNRGRAALDDAIADAARWVRTTQGVGKTGIGRLAVKTALEGMAASGTRLLPWDDYLALCEEVQADGKGTITSPRHLVEYLHNIGTVFYRRGLFGDQLILDQAWALEKVYAVFDREQASFKRIERNGGRFIRADLAETVWRANSPGEQALFLSFMQQCAICFALRKGDRARDDEDAVYIVPELLPPRTHPDIAGELAQKWDAELAGESATLSYELLPPGLLRTLMARIGDKAGMSGEYWRDGFYFWDQETGSRALIEQRWTKDWAGDIVISTQKGQAATLRDRLLTMVEEDRVGLGAKPISRTVSAGEGSSARAAQREREGEPRQAFITPNHEPSATDEYYVSYAWGDATHEGREREAVVDKLCDAAERQGKRIIRDKTAMQLGDRISRFMARIGRGDRIFIVLSDKYLRSAYCMHELHEVWRQCRGDDAEFIARTRVFVLPSAEIDTVARRAQYAIHWKKALDDTGALVKAHGQLVLSDDDNADYRRMLRFAGETANILRLVHDTLRPASFEDFVKYGLGGG